MGRQSRFRFSAVVFPECGIRRDQSAPAAHLIRERERETGLNDDPPQREREDFRRAANISTWPGVGFAITVHISTLHIKVRVDI